MELSAFLVLGCVILPNVAAQIIPLPRIVNDIAKPGIVNGVDATPGEIPYQASLQILATGFHFCGGSVLNENYVVTAAHCVTDRISEDIRIVAGTVDLDQPGSTSNVTRIISHPDYNAGDSWRNDIALLEVGTPFTSSPTLDFVTLPAANESVATNAEAVVSGWGRQFQGGPSTTLLKRADVIITDQDTCAQIYNAINYNVYGTQVCAYDPDVERGFCQGDSGGPLTVDGILIGIVSWAAGCGEPEYPGVYTRVPAYVDWINTNAV